MKRILLLVMMFASIVVLSACGTTKNPMISNPEGNYLTVTEGSNTYTVKNKKIYELLKDQVGYQILMDMIDKDLLKNTFEGDKSFWDSITEEEIEKKLEKDIFPSGTDELDEDEIAKKKEEHFDKLFYQFGLLTEADVNDYYRLQLAKEAYAKVQMENKVAEKDFTETEYKTYFNNNFKDEYYAIVVSFGTSRLLENSLKQLGYKFVTTNFVTSIVKEDGSELTNDQAVKLFIELYNMVNAAKVEDYPNKTLLLKEGTHYKLVNGKVVFDLDELDVLHYTNREITSYEKLIQERLAKFDNYDSGDNFYSKSPLESKGGARTSLFMKIAEVKHDFETEKEEIKKALIKQKVTGSYINNEILKLRDKNNIGLFDSEFIGNFSDALGALDIKFTRTKSNNKTLVAKTDVKEYTADDLFAVMNRNYGMSSAISELEFIRFLDNLNINNIYDFKNKKVLDATRWTVIQQSIKDEKANFKKDLYAENGYPAKMGWDKFIKAVYGANSEYELERFFVFQDVKDRYAKSLGSLEGAKLDGERWQFYLKHMEKAVEDFFQVEGVHLLIRVNDKNGNPTDPKDWTNVQVELAKDFYNQVMDYINNENLEGSAKEKIKNVQNAFNRAPYFVAGLPQDTNSQPVIPGASYVFNGIEVSKFKTAGLVASFEDLGKFKNGMMVEEFNNAAKSIWDANSDSSETFVYGSTKNEEGNYEHLVTVFGYHVYVNTKTFPLDEYSKGKVIPEIGDAKVFLKDKDSSDLSSKLKTALTTYFEPVHTDLVSVNHLQYVSYKQILELEFVLGHEDYEVKDLQKFLELTIANREEKLAYK